MLVRAVRRHQEGCVSVRPRFSVRKAIRFRDQADHIHAETVNSLLQPPVHHAEYFVPHNRIIPVEVRLFFGEQMQVIHTRLLIKLPGAAAEA